MPRPDRFLTHARQAGKISSRLAGNAGLAAVTGTRSIAEDPVTFAVQLTRRFPKARAVLATIADRAAGVDRELAAAFFGGDVEATRAIAAEAARGGLSRLGAEIAQATGLPELVAFDSRIRPGTRARAAWQLGEASLAIELAAAAGASSRFHRALRAELALMTPGTRLRWRAPSGDSRRAGRADIAHLLTNSIPHTQSGYTIRSHQVLLAQRAAGLEVVAMTRVGYPVIVGGLSARAFDQIDGIRYYRALPTVLSPTPDGRLTQQADAFARLARDWDARVLATTSHYPNAIVARAVAESLGLSWVYEVRGIPEQTWLASLANPQARDRAAASERYRLTRAREAELANAADAVVTLGEQMADDLASRGVPRDRIALAPNAVDARLRSLPRIAPGQARAELGVPTAGTWVGALSSLVEYEGFDVLLRAVSAARSHGADVRALLVGEGVSRPALARLVSELGLDDVTVMPGRVPRDQTEAWRLALDVFVVPRLDREVTRTVSPLKPVEAMASGTALVVSDLPPLTEIVGPEMVKLGATVPAGDVLALASKLAHLTNRPDARAALAEAGRRRAAARTWDAVGDTYSKVFGSVRGRPSVP